MLDSRKSNRGLVREHYGIITGAILRAIQAEIRISSGIVEGGPHDYGPECSASADERTHKVDDRCTCS